MVSMVVEVTPVGVTSVGVALDAFTAALDHLVMVVEDGGLQGGDAVDLVAVLQGFERVRNRMALVDHQLIAEATAGGVPEALAQPSMARVLVQALRISAAEAARRVHAAAALGRRTSMLGEPLDPVRPHPAAAQGTGEVSPERAGIVSRALESVDRRGFDPDAIEAGERLLADFATRYEPADLRRLTAQVVDRIDPDGTRPEEELTRDRRHLTLRPTEDGGYAGEFRLTGALGAKLTALLGPLARPRTTGVETADGRRNVEADPRTRGQRWHDALDEVCDRLLRAGSVPDAGGTPATVIVTIDLEDLLARTGHGTTSDGTIISAAEALHLAGQAEVVPTVLARSGAVLDLGRTRRIASSAQTLALYARDGGCSFPGCDRPPEYCERHHILAWIDGGPTSLDNLTLLCRFHHHYFASRGWTCRMSADRLPEWIPPRWLDRQQRPLLNHRIQANAVARRNRREGPGRRAGLDQSGLVSAGAGVGSASP